MYSKIDLSGLGSRSLRRSRRFGGAWLPDRSLILLAGCYLLGAVTGVRAIGYLPDDMKEGVLSIFADFLEIRAGQTLQQTAASSFGQNILLVAILFLLGFCAISLPLIPCVVLFKGMGYGVTATAMLDYAAGGGSLLRLGLLIVPFAVASALIVIVAARHSARLSVGCYRTLRDGKGEREMDIAGYCRSFLLLLLAAGFVSVADALLYRLLAPGLFY